MFVLGKIKEYAKSDRIAIVNREETLTFTELDALSDAFAVWLLEKFRDDRRPVVIYGHKETAFLPCIYGALKAGRAYVPVDLAVPPGRAAEIVKDIAPKVIVDFSGTGFVSGDAICLRGDELDAILRRQPGVEAQKAVRVSGDTPAYIMFTSGSTGKPKGVPITVNNLTNFYHGLLPYIEEDGGVILNQVSYSFDVSGCSIYAGLSRGMTLFTLDKEIVADMGAMFRVLRQSGLTIWVSTPSFAEMCAQSKAFSSELLPHLRKFLFCGETLTHKLCDLLAERFPQAQILNTYGPTEATVLVTAVLVTDDMRRDARPIPIGYPLEEVILRLVDDNGAKIEKDEESGELLIISDSVGPGYHRRPEQTQRRFFLDEKSGKRGYRTGDICYRKDGLYYYTGRADNQLKISGHRVELEDVENNLAKLDNIARAAVIPIWADAERSRVQYLAAVLLLEKEDGLSSIRRCAQIKKQAAAFLPSYMIPRKIITVDSFPLNTSGKIDRKELAKRLQKAGTA